MRVSLQNRFIPAAQQLEHQTRSYYDQSNKISLWAQQQT